MTYKHFEGKMAQGKEKWLLGDWSIWYSNADAPIPTQEEITYMIRWLREHHYPVPVDCLQNQCIDFRPSCLLNVCKFAVCMCGDF